MFKLWFPGTFSHVIISSSGHFRSLYNMFPPSAQGHACNHGKLNIPRLTATSFGTSPSHPRGFSRVSILRRRKATCPGTVKAKSTHNSNKRSWPTERIREWKNLQHEGGRSRIDLEAKRKKPRRFEIKNDMGGEKPQKHLDVPILYYSMKNLMDRLSRRRREKFMSSQFWSSKGGTLKRWICLIFGGHIFWLRFQALQHITTGLCHTPKLHFSNGLNFLGIHFWKRIYSSRKSGSSSRIISVSHKNRIPFMDTCAMPPQLPPHWNFTTIPK